MDAWPAPTHGRLPWRAAASALSNGLRAPARADQVAPTTWSKGAPPRRLVDLLRVEPGYRIGFLDDPAGRAAQLAGEMLGRESGVFLYGVTVRAGLTVQTYDDECFDLVVAAGGSKHWTLVSKALAEARRLVRSGGTVAVVTPHPLSLLGRGLSRVPRPGADPGDAQAIAVGKRLVEVFGSLVRTELGARVVWHVTRQPRH